MTGLSRRLGAEFIGTALLLATVVGSGIMGARLSGGNMALALLANSVATGAMLFVLIHMFEPVSGAHFNPAVSATMALRGEMTTIEAAAFAGAQASGGLAGVFIAHIMFDLPILQISATVRTGLGQWSAELVATFGLILTILACKARNSSVTAAAVALYILGAYWFTASTSFANPAVTLARAFTDTFAGIAPSNVLAFMLAQVIGAGLAIVTAAWLFPESAPKTDPHH